jgi:hypothetical protein
MQIFLNIFKMNLKVKFCKMKKEIYTLQTALAIHVKEGQNMQKYPSLR